MRTLPSMLTIIAVTTLTPLGNAFAQIPTLQQQQQQLNQQGQQFQQRVQELNQSAQQQYQQPHKDPDAAATDTILPLQQYQQRPLMGMQPSH